MKLSREATEACALVVEKAIAKIDALEAELARLRDREAEARSRMLDLIDWGVSARSDRKVPEPHRVDEAGTNVEDGCDCGYCAAVRWLEGVKP